MKALWAGTRAEYHGEFVDFPPVTCSPRPLQASIPIMVGGDTPAAIRRAARYGDRYFPGTTDPEHLQARVADMRAAAEAEKRDPDSIEINAIFGQQIADPRAGVEQFEKAGVDCAMVPAFFFAGPGGLERLDDFAEKAIAR